MKGGYSDQLFDSFAQIAPVPWPADTTSTSTPTSRQRAAGLSRSTHLPFPFEHRKNPTPLKGTLSNEAGHISSYHSTSIIDSSCFPVREVTIHVPIANFHDKELDRQSPSLESMPDPHSTRPLQVVGLLEVRHFSASGWARPGWT